MGRHYPDIHADPVKTHGYYYSKKSNKLARLKPGDKLPRHMGPWEFIARDDEGTSSEVLQKLRRLHPEIDPYRLSFATSTPVDMPRLARMRNLRRLRWAALGVAVLGAGLWLGNRPSYRKRRSFFS